MSISELKYSSQSAPYVQFLSAPHHAHKSIMALSSLKHGWHYGQGLPPSPEASVAAVAFAELLCMASGRDLAAFPDISGAVMINADIGDVYVEVECTPEGSVNIFIQHPGAEGEDHEALTESEAKQMIGEFEWQPSDTSGWFTPSTMTYRGESLNR